jgi:hypothetical protein
MKEGMNKLKFYPMINQIKRDPAMGVLSLVFPSSLLSMILLVVSIASVGFGFRRLTTAAVIGAICSLA